MHFEVESSAGSEYSDSEESLPRPTFVPKAQRETILAEEKKRAAEQLRDEQHELETALKKSRTRLEVAESIRRATEKQHLDNVDGYDSDRGMPDCDDSADVDLEIEKWKLREINRLKRDEEERERHATEQADIQRRRNMTDAERMKEDEEAGRFQQKERTQMSFLQKYYHKGAFYMDSETVKKEDDVRLKDYNAPTLGDHTDKEKLPQIMQVKNFGKRSRTKYTHLVDQDTTLNNQQRVDYRLNKQILDKYKSKMSGV